jgi:pimeloyl-ACP methyl ester carboxylesterase
MIVTFIFLLAIAVAFVLAGLAFQAFGKRKDRSRYPAPGRYILVDGRRFHVREEGTGQTVVLEAGIASTSLGWVNIQKALREEARVITYDRAGLGWSDRASGPRTLQNAVAELRAVLEANNTPKPYLLVGHSYGGLIVRQFAACYPDEVAGLVLVDPVNTRDWAPLTEIQRNRLRRGVKLSRRGALLARLGVVRLALSLLERGNRRLPKLISRWSAGSGASATERLTGEVRKLPKEVWPMIRMHWCDEKCFSTMAEYLERLPANAEAASAKPWPVDIPTIVLTVLTAVPDLPEGVTHRLATRSGHWIQLDEPGLVLTAIRELLQAQKIMKPGPGV